MDKEIEFGGHTILIDDKGNLKVKRESLPIRNGDYGCDPIGDGLFRMVPSGDVVSLEEMRLRLKK